MSTQTIPEAMVKAAAAALANARGGKRGMPPIKNVLDLQPAKLHDEVMEEARSALADAGVGTLLAAITTLTTRAHVLQIDAQGWALEHPLLCRAEYLRMTDCPLHLAASALTQMPAPVGRYFARLLNGQLDLGVEADEDPAPQLIAVINKLKGEK